MKKLFALIMVLVMCLSLLAGCATESVEPEAKEYTRTSMFVEVERSTNWCVVYHRDTKVMYVESGGTYNRGTFTLLVNADGTPMLWED